MGLPSQYLFEINRITVKSVKKYLQHARQWFKELEVEDDHIDWYTQETLDGQYAAPTTCSNNATMLTTFARQEHALNPPLQHI